MDPFSIVAVAGSAASAAQTAWKVGEMLLSFYTDMKVVDRTVTGMASEVQALSSALTLVDERLRDIVQDFDAEIKKPGADPSQLWKCVEVQVHESQKSVNQLRAAFQFVRKGNPNLIGQAWRQVKLNMQAKDIGEARNRIRSHTVGLQTVLQTVAILICHLTPQRADRQLRTLISGVEGCIGELQALRLERKDLTSARYLNEMEILSIGKTIASNGESLYAASVADHSVQGSPTSFEQQVKIREWMKDIIAIDKNLSDPSNEDNEIQSAGSSGNDPSIGLVENSTLRGTLVGASSITEPEGIDSSNGDNVDSDDEFQLDVAKEALAAAWSFFEAKNYQEASSYLNEALKLIRELPSKQQSICDTWNSRFMLSVCAYYTQEPAEAEADLQEFLDNSYRSSNQSKEQMCQVFEVGHLVSQIYVKLGRFEQARFYCDNALQGRRRILGKLNPETYQSMALMARIFELQGGKDYRAKTLLRMIPNEDREPLERSFRELEPLPQSEGAIRQHLSTPQGRRASNHTIVTEASCSMSPDSPWTQRPKDRRVPPKSQSQLTLDTILSRSKASGLKKEMRVSHDDGSPKKSPQPIAEVLGTAALPDRWIVETPFQCDIMPYETFDQYCDRLWEFAHRTVIDLETSKGRITLECAKQCDQEQSKPAVEALLRLWNRALVFANGTDLAGQRLQPTPITDLPPTHCYSLSLESLATTAPSNSEKFAVKIEIPKWMLLYIDPWSQTFCIADPTMNDCVLRGTVSKGSSIALFIADGKSSWSGKSKNVTIKETSTRTVFSELLSTSCVALESWEVDRFDLRKGTPC